MTALHKSMADYQLAGSGDINTSSALHYNAATGMPLYLDMADSATRNLLQSLAGKRPQVPVTADGSPNRSHSPVENYPIDGWRVFEATENTQLDRSVAQEGVALIAQSLLYRLDDLSGDESNDERSESEGEEIPEVVVPGAYFYCVSTLPFQTFPTGTFGSMDAGPDGPPQKCSRNMQNDNPTDPTAKWYPWRDKIVGLTCIGTHS